MFVTGAAVQWLRDGLGIIAEAAETEGLAASLDSNDDVYFVPALTGLGSPHWDPYARGHDRRAHPRHAPAPTWRARRSRRSPTRRSTRSAPRSGAAGEQLAELRADGGAVANRWLMQFQADVLGAPVIVPEIAETTALGAAYLAGIGDRALDRRARSARCGARRRGYEPRMGQDERERLLGRAGAEAVERSRGWAERVGAGSRTGVTGAQRRG